MGGRGGYVRPDPTTEPRCEGGIIKVLDGGVGVGDDDGTMFTSSFNLLSLGLLLSGAGEV